jgi:hypothetical protein
VQAITPPPLPAGHFHRGAAPVSDRRGTDGQWDATNKTMFLHGNKHESSKFSNCRGFSLIAPLPLSQHLMDEAHKQLARFLKSRQLELSCFVFTGTVRLFLCFLVLF